MKLQKEPRKYTLYESSDVSRLMTDFYERQAGVDRMMLSPVTLAQAGDVEKTRDALRAITKSATEVFQNIPSRDILAQMNAIRAHLAVLRVNEHKSPYFVDTESPMERMVCEELQAAIEEIYNRQKFDNITLAAHSLLGTLAQYGTYSDRAAFTGNSRYAVDEAFLVVLNRMDEQERQNLMLIAREKFTPTFNTHIHELQDNSAYAPKPEKSLDSQLQTMAL